ncbi:mucin-5AC [Orussus abietinus]|uniref:mucin-5AC n=1 Tax=Orussus abietinus TaxID=222816 RepID=UPI0006268F6D|nr:mucin-5AC [Orussus abietinus]
MIYRLINYWAQIVRRRWSWLLPVGLILGIGSAGSAEGERWSRQVSNSEWIPMANPRAGHGIKSHRQIEGDSLPAGTSQLSQVQSLSLPPALQQQYQQQLQQLQKTQESIRELLALQQQLRNQQQHLQNQAFLPTGFGNPGEGKQALRQSTVANLQAIPELAPEVLVPPIPSSDELPPVFAAQEFLPRPARLRQDVPQQAPSFGAGQGQTTSGREQGDPEETERTNGKSAESQIRHQDASASGKRFETARKLKEGGRGNFVTQPTINPEDEDEEIQLVYVPAEALARGPNQEKFGKHRGREHRFHQQHLQQGAPSTTISPAQEAYARDLLEQLQRDHEEKNQLLRDQRMKEIARLSEEQKELEKQARYHQEVVFREHEAQRQREAEKMRKELDKLEEMAKQRELERLREAREKQKVEEDIARQDELRRLAQLQLLEEQRKRDEQVARQAEIDSLAALERQKEMQIQQAIRREKQLEQIVQKQREDRARNRDGASDLPQAQALIRNGEQQHLTEVPAKPAKGNGRIRTKPRARTHQTHQGHQAHLGDQEHRFRSSSPAPSTTPSPNQPPLSVYMGRLGDQSKSIKVTDVLRLLKDARTIAVLDTVGPDSPRVFVGPSNLDPPPGYSKFDLPYLSSIDNNRVERKVDRLPFFVAPLSFHPPPGYSKIPFPAPHIGSVVVNTLDGSQEPENRDQDIVSPSPLIEPNAYIEPDRPFVRGPFEGPRAVPAQSGPTSPKYNQAVSSTSPSGSRFRFRQFFGEDGSSSQTLDDGLRGSSTTPVTPTGDESRDPGAGPKHDSFLEGPSRSTTGYQTPIFTTTGRYPNQQEDPVTSRHPVNGPDPGSRDEPTKEQDLAAQLALVNRELAHHRDSSRFGPDLPEFLHRPPSAKEVAGPVYQENVDQGGATRPPEERRGSLGTLEPESGSDGGRGHEDHGVLVGPTQYSLPAELPPISPHLPGLVNSLVDAGAGNQGSTSGTTSSIGTTPRTTTESPVTTYRTRGRQRGRVAVRPTTQSPSTTSSPRSSGERTRRPFGRSRSRFTTTTEEYHEPEPSYEPTKATFPETTPRYGGQEQYRKSTARNQRVKIRNGDRNHGNAEDHDQPTNSHRTQSIYDSESAGPHSQASATSQEPESPVYFHEEFSSTTPSPSTNDYNSGAPSSQTTSGFRDSEIYSRDQNYPSEVSQPPQDSRQDPYHPGFQVSSTGPSNLEETPVNGFNYQARTEGVNTATPRTTSKDFSYYNEKPEDYDFAGESGSPRVQEQTQSNFEAAALQGQQTYPGLGPREHFGDAQSEKSTLEEIPGIVHPSEQPALQEFMHGKTDEYSYRVSTADVPLEVTTQATTVPLTTATSPTTTEAPVIIRQRVRGRLGGRSQHQDSPIQTRPRGSQEEYVRFSAVKQEPLRTVTRQRDHSQRPRTRTRNHPRIQTDEQEYVRIQGSAQYQRPSPIPTTSTTTTTSRPEQEDLPDYGFIRPPSFHPVLPVDRFQGQQESTPSTDDTAVESSPVQSEILKNRQKYQSNRRPSVPSSTTGYSSFDQPATTPGASSATSSLNSVYTARPRSRQDEQKPVRGRGRIRRPGKKRPSTTTMTPATTSTEPTLETHNELPLDENYPRIVQSAPDPGPDQRFLYEDEYQSRIEPSGQRYQAPRQDFVLNFGVHPRQGDSQREEYDQTQLASDPPTTRKYSSLPSRPRTQSFSGIQQQSDIYGAESQWSPKLSGNSFQPSIPQEEAKNPPEVGLQAEESEIVTAGPEDASITVFSSYEGRKPTEVLAQSTSKITTSEELVPENQSHPEGHSSGSSSTLMVESSQVRERNSSESSSSPEVVGDNVAAGSSGSPGSPGRVNVEEQHEEPAKVLKKVVDPLAVGKGLKRRRVRVRVRPAVEDFVTAESQDIGSAAKNLLQGKEKSGMESKYGNRGSEETVDAEEVPRKSILEDVLEMFGGSDVQSSRAPLTTTDHPEEPWTVTVSSADPEAATTTSEIAEKNTEIYSTPTGAPGSKTITVVIPDTTMTMTTTPGTTPSEDSKTTLDRQEFLTRYHMAQNFPRKFQPSSIGRVDPESSETPKRLQNEESEVSSGTEQVVNNENHPKNHRMKWNEVRWPSGQSLFDYSKFNPWVFGNQSTEGGTGKREFTGEPGNTETSGTSASPEVVADYVKAIFSSIESDAAESITSVDPEETKSSPPVETETTTIPEVPTSSRATSKNSTVPEEVPENRGESRESGSTLEAASVIDSMAGSTTLEVLSSSTTPSTLDVTPTGKVLRTSTATKVSHMTEICYRGKCVMTRSKKEARAR